MRLKKAHQPSLFDDLQGHPVSFTQLSTFLRCPTEYKLRFIDRRETKFSPSGSGIFLGRILHKISFDYLSLPLSQRSSSFLFSQLEILIKSYKNLDKENITLLQSSAQLLSGSFLTNSEIIALERPFNTTFRNYRLRGRADCVALIDGRIGLVEFKTDDFREFDCKDDIDQYLQLIFYTIGLVSQGLEPMIAGYYFYNQGSFISKEMSPSFLAEGEERIAHILEAMHRGVLPIAKSNRFCTTCGYRRLCSVFKNA